MKEDATVSQAVGKYVNIGPQKCQLVTDLIRDRYSKKRKASSIVEKVLRSAIANAQQKLPDIDVDNLYISRIFVNHGPQMKRWKAAPMGRAARILKRTSHVHVYLEDRKGR
jgi:large subunit ribosomal protein L22